jgi:hypothetical protein
MCNTQWESGRKYNLKAAHLKPESQNIKDKKNGRYKLLKLGPQSITGYSKIHPRGRKRDYQETLKKQRYQNESVCHHLVKPRQELHIFP